jgi:hypothetical protein
MLGAQKMPDMFYMSGQVFHVLHPANKSKSGAAAAHFARKNIKWERDSSIPSLSLNHIVRFKSQERIHPSTVYPHGGIPKIEVHWKLTPQVRGVCHSVKVILA